MQTINGKRLRLERIAQGLTQKELAKKAQLATMTVHHYETRGGHIRGDCLALLAQALNVSEKWLAEWPETDDNAAGDKETQPNAKSRP